MNVSKIWTHFPSIRTSIRMIDLIRQFVNKRGSCIRTSFCITILRIQLPSVFSSKKFNVQQFDLVIELREES